MRMLPIQPLHTVARHSLQGFPAFVRQKQLEHGEVEELRWQEEEEAADLLIAALMAYGLRVADRIRRTRSLDEVVQAVRSAAPGNDLARALRRIYERTLPRSAQAQFARLLDEAREEARDVDWQQGAAALYADVERRGIIASMNSTTADEAARYARRIAEAAVRDGAPAASYGRRVADEFVPTFRVRVRTRVGGAAGDLGMAATEASTAMNRGMSVGTEFAARETGGRAVYTWNCSFQNSRDAHIAAHGQTRREGETFTVGGETCKAPHDPALSAAQRANCKCFLTCKLELSQ